MMLFNIKSMEIQESTKEAISNISSMSSIKIKIEIEKTEYLLEIEKDKDYKIAYMLYLESLNRELKEREEN